MTSERRNALRTETGMRRLLEIEASAADAVVSHVGGVTDEKGAIVRADGTRLAYRMIRRDYELPSIRPVLLLAEGLSDKEAEAKASRYLSDGRTVMTAMLRSWDGTDQSLARRAEDALALARLLSHKNAGKTVEVYAHGNAVAAAALMMALERGYFSVLTAENPPPDHVEWPSWKEMAE